MLGNISYALYMFHGVTGELTLKIILPKLAITSPDTQLIILNCITLPVTVIASYAFFKLVEKPAMSLSRRFEGPMLLGSFSSSRGR